jgi:hypothetical protein
MCSTLGDLTPRAYRPSERPPFIHLHMWMVRAPLSAGVAPASWAARPVPSRGIGLARLCGYPSWTPSHLLPSPPPNPDHSPHGPAGEFRFRLFAAHLLHFPTTSHYPLVKLPFGSPETGGHFWLLLISGWVPKPPALTWLYLPAAIVGGIGG